MTDKEEIKFAIRYLKKGLKSKRTPPLYEELMKELGFVSEKDLGKLEGKLADLTSEYIELENLKNNEIAELKAYNEKHLNGDIEKHNKIVELQNRNSELAGQKASLEHWLGEAKEIIKNIIRITWGEGWNYDLWKVEVEKFLQECEG